MKGQVKIMNFDYEKHQQLWRLLSVHIAEAIKDNYKGGGYYSGYSALDRLKRQLLQKDFPEDDMDIHNLCFGCDTAVTEKENREWYEPDTIDCQYCPIKWKNGLQCDDRNSLYMQLIDQLHSNEVSAAAETCRAIANVEPYTDKEYEKKIPCHMFHKAVSL